MLPTVRWVRCTPSRSRVHGPLLWGESVLNANFETQCKYRTQSKKMLFLNTWETVKKKKRSVHFGVNGNFK